MISKITHAFVRRYSDNNATVAYIEWVDHHGRAGRTEAHVKRIETHRGRPVTYYFGAHMHVLIVRAKREGISLTRERW